MPNDVHLNEAEDDFNQARERAICHDAGILVTQGFSRNEALAKAESIFEAQQDAMNDVTGAKATLAEAQSPQMPEGAAAQVAAIAQKLYESRNPPQE
jgi:hypothetical protein